jgi:regulator of cell morphogenesis and NO signaling
VVVQFVGNKNLKQMKPTDKMSALITRNYKMLLVLSRFGIALGFGDKNIREVCEENAVDTDTFLIITDLLLTENFTLTNKTLEVDTIVKYLQNSHKYFLLFRLPQIREKLANVLETGEHELAKAILFYFDEYVAEVEKHMDYEEKTLFPYILDLLAHKKSNYKIEMFVKQHNQVEARLKELKMLIIKYYPVKSTNEINSVLFDIFSCEEDLASHNDIEDRLLVPYIMKIEKSVVGNK